MSRPVQFSATPDFTAYSEIIDVRSPAEYTEDHVPGALNYYVLDNEERAQVGTLYKQVDAFTAKKTGASLVAANIAHWIATQLVDRPRDYRPLVYCWRGGQRSMSMATVLAQIGWEVTVIEGGYKRYRRWVQDELAQQFATQPMIILAGLTGTAKTELLQRLEDAGEQVLDLESLAVHRGSLLGELPDEPQPQQKYFESLLAQRVQQLDQQRPLWVEAESNKIGNLYCPAPLWQRMRQAPSIQVRAPLEARVAYLLHHYERFLHDPQALKDKLIHLKARQGRAVIDHWFSLIDSGAWETLVAELLEHHYDPSYRRSGERLQRERLDSLDLHSLQPEALDQAVQALIRIGNPT